eukprot:6196628-Pleurochrysis_carterae.AAC.3
MKNDRFVNINVSQKRQCIVTRGCGWRYDLDLAAVVPRSDRAACASMRACTCPGWRHKNAQHNTAPLAGAPLQQAWLGLPAGGTAQAGGKHHADGKATEERPPRLVGLSLSCVEVSAQNVGKRSADELTC